MAPKIIIVAGTQTHSRIIAIFFQTEYSFGRLGNKREETAAERIMPIIAKFIKKEEIAGRLPESTVELKRLPPISIGIQPMTAIIKALVAQE